MILSGLVLQNFRSYKQYVLQFTAKTTVLIGPNAAGKTSIIESVALLSTGSSFRATKVEQMISFDQELGRVKGKIIEADAVLESKNEAVEPTLVEVILTTGMVNGKRTLSTLFSVNAIKRRKKDAVGKFFTVVFRPEDMRLIEGSPTRRRIFLDTVLSLLYPEYEFALRNYEQTLKRRNKLLFQIKEGKQPKTVLHFWNLNLVKHGEILQNYRRDFLASFSGVIFPVSFEVEYQPSVISQKNIMEHQEKEMIVGHTLIGPHKDDFFVYLNDKSRKLRLDIFGSRGQQRLGVLWLKFCELEFLKNTSKKQTVLLLDDILSELDDDSKVLALSVLNGYQSIITSTEEAVVAEIKNNSESVEVLQLGIAK